MPIKRPLRGLAHRQILNGFFWHAADRLGGHQACYEREAEYSIILAGTNNHIGWHDRVII